MVNLGKAKPCDICHNYSYWVFCDTCNDYYDYCTGHFYNCAPSPDKKRRCAFCKRRQGILNEDNNPALFLGGGAPDNITHMIKLSLIYKDELKVQI